MKRIGGVLDLGALMLLAGRDSTRPHRLPDPATLRAAAVELHSRGLTPHAIADALGLSEPAVRQLLGEP